MLGVKSISFTEEYREEFLHLLTQANKSRYICELIRKDIRNTSAKLITEAKILELIDSRIKNLPQNVIQNEGDTEEIRSNLMDLFGDF